jgi:hypothetical protein
MLSKHPIESRLSPADMNELRDHLSGLPNWKRGRVWELLATAVSTKEPPRGMNKEALEICQFLESFDEGDFMPSDKCQIYISSNACYEVFVRDDGEWLARERLDDEAVQGDGLQALKEHLASLDSGE